jgi:polyphosphate kinase
MRHPLLERLRFLSISASNLDEFYMVRVAGLKGMVNAGISTLSDDGLTPAQQLSRVDQMAGELINDQQKTWRELRAALANVGIAVIEPGQLSPEDRSWLDDEFNPAESFRSLTPLAIDPAHPFRSFPIWASRHGAQASRAAPTKGQPLTALLPVPSQLQRFVRLPDRSGKARFITLENLIGLYLDRLFPGYVVLAGGAFRILRDSDIEVEEEAEDLVRLYETMLKRRRRGQVIRLKCSASMPPDLRRYIADQLNMDGREPFVVDGLLGLDETKQLILDERPDLQFQALHVALPRTHPRSAGGDCFAAIQAKDLIVHHPFESFDGGAVPASGRRRSRRGGDQADAVPHEQG